MTTPINLNKARKAKAKAVKLAKSEQNRAKFGRTKQQKVAAAHQADKMKQALNAHKLEE
jgi:hypothetical protein